MKATLSFNLPEEAEEHRIAVNAPETAMLVSMLDAELRSRVKYGHNFTTADEAMSWVRGEIAKFPT